MGSGGKAEVGHCVFHEVYARVVELAGPEAEPPAGLPYDYVWLTPSSRPPGYDGCAGLPAELERHFGQLVFKARVPRSVRVAEAPSHGLPVIAYDRSSAGAIW